MTTRGWDRLYISCVVAFMVLMIAATGDAQGRFWVLVNGALRYTGIVQINGGPLLNADGTSGAPAIAFASEPTLGFWRSGASNVSLAGSLSATGALFAGASNVIGWTGLTRLYALSGQNGTLAITNAAQSIGSTLKVDALPTVSACGAGSPSVAAGSTPLAGAVIIGTTSVATCTITFGGTAFPSAPACTSNTATATPANIRAVGVTSSTTQLVLVPASAWADSSIVSWICISPK